jgi:putative restriction endonuclease
MDAMTADNLFRLEPGETMPRRLLYDIIQFSKQPGSRYWGGPESQIGNTPQQGINWIGRPPTVRGVIIKTKLGSYAGDGWVDEEHGDFRYSFKARKTVVDLTELANRVLVEQPLSLYPVLLFAEAGTQWRFEGRFDVSQIAERHVVLRRQSALTSVAPEVSHPVWCEGGKRYVTHLLAERSGALVKWLKGAAEHVCDVCGDNASSRYTMPVIDAHHRTPLSVWTEEHEVTAGDIALVCPNCHRAVHATMRGDPSLTYDAIRLHIRARLAVPD